jgi:hypothetical protein
MLDTNVRQKNRLLIHTWMYYMHIDIPMSSVHGLTTILLSTETLEEFGIRMINVEKQLHQTAVSAPQAGQGNSNNGPVATDPL